MDIMEEGIKKDKKLILGMEIIDKTNILELLGEQMNMELKVQIKFMRKIHNLNIRRDINIII